MSMLFSHSDVELDMVELNPAPSPPGPTLKDVAILYRFIQSRSQHLPLHPVRVPPVSRAKLAIYVARLDFTKGNTMKLKLLNAFHQKLLQKYRAKKAREQAEEQAEVDGLDYSGMNEYDKSLSLSLNDVSKDGLAALIENRLRQAGISQDELNASALKGSDDDGENGEGEEYFTGGVGTPVAVYVFQLRRAQLKVFDHHADHKPFVSLAKIDMLKPQLGNIVRDPKAMALLWKAVDVNNSGKVGMQEWLGFAKEKFGILSQKRPLNRAYKDTLFAQTSGRFDIEDENGDAADANDDTPAAEGKDASSEERAQPAAGKSDGEEDHPSRAQSPTASNGGDGGDGGGIVDANRKSPGPGRKKGRRRSSMISEAIDGGMVYEAFPYFLARLLRISQLYYAFSYLDKDADDNVDKAEYTTGRKKFRSALDFHPNPIEEEDEDLAARIEFNEIVKDDAKIGWNGMADWFHTQVEAGNVRGMGPDWGDGDGSGDGRAQNTVAGAKVDADDFCDLVLFCQYKSRVTPTEIVPIGKEMANTTASSQKRSSTISTVTLSGGGEGSGALPAKTILPAI